MKKVKVAKVLRMCSAPKCEEVHYARGFCNRHYNIERSAGRLEKTDRGVAIPPPPPPPPDKKRCRARMKDGSRCIGSIKAQGFCSAHNKEARSRLEFAIREHPLDAVGGGFEGRENELIAE
jgi:hypothetical protein